MLKISDETPTPLPSDTNEPIPPATDLVTATITSDKKPAKVKLTGRMLNFTRLSITGNDFEQITALLQQKFANQPNSNMLVVLSCEEKLDLSQLLTTLWELGLQPIGIVTGQMDDQAREQKLAIFPADGKRINVLVDNKSPAKTVKNPPTQKVETPATTADSSPKKGEGVAVTTPQSETAQNTTLHHTMAEDNTSYISSLPQTSHLDGDMVYSTMLRSGQSINHVGGDLVLTQGINAGAEAITDYSLHVYGKAEGRLVAGATGDEKARIFCLRFNPSLVSVAGTFCLRENIPSEFLDKAVQVHYQSGKGLVFTLMNA